MILYSTRSIFVLVLVLVLVLGLRPSSATEPQPAAPAAAATPELAPSTSMFQKLITSLVLEHLPHEYEDNRKWGGTARRWNGLSLQLDDFELKTHRKFKEVNHGTWTAYRLELIEPEKNFQFSITDVRTLPDGRLGCNVAVESPLECFGRMAKWEKGVQLISLSAEATARVRLKVACAVTTRIDTKHFPPDVALQAEVTSAEVELVDFRTHKVSKVGGEIAQQLGKGIRSVVDDKLAEKRGTLVEKINGQLTKHEDKLRFSLHDLASSQWSQFTDLVSGQDKEKEKSAAVPAGNSDQPAKR